MKELQRKILFGMAGFTDEKDGLCMNPFYKCAEEAIQDNPDYAKEIYPKVFKEFLASWFAYKGSFNGLPKCKEFGELMV